MPTGTPETVNWPFDRLSADGPMRPVIASTSTTWAPGTAVAGACCTVPVTTP